MVVLHQPRDLVNIALVVRAMKNMGLTRLRLVQPAEFDPHRIEGIAHDTADLVERTEIHDSLRDALSDVVRVVGTTARRRAMRHEWSTPEQAAPELLRHTRQGDVALLFGREDRGLTNRELDLCHGLLSIPTNPEHTSMNLAHAALVIFHELRKAADREVDLPDRDLSTGKDRAAPPPTAGELEDFFEVWRDALDEVGFFHGIDPTPKMRSFRAIFRRAGLDRIELDLLRAAAYEVVHYARRLRHRMSDADAAGDESPPDAGAAGED